MPTYEYACKSCGEHLEVVQSFRDDALTTCAACGGELRKVFGAIGIAFKGSGFYRTDSRSDGRAPARAKGGDKGAETAGGGGEAGAKGGKAKADDKPAGSARPSEPKAAASS